MEDVQNLVIDPEFEGLLPPTTPAEYEELEKDIIANGCRESIKAWGDVIIDGHNRFLICGKHNIPYKVEQIALPDRAAALLWIVRNQLARRNLTSLDRVQLALRFKDVFAAHAKENQRQSCGRGQKGKLKKTDLFASGGTRAAVAELAGVSESTVSAIEFVNKCGSPEIQEQLKNSQISVSAAQQLVRNQIKQEQGNKRFPPDWRLVEPRKVIQTNRELITKLKSKLQKIAEESGSVKAEIKTLQEQNRALQLQISDLKGKSS